MLLLLGTRSSACAPARLSVETHKQMEVFKLSALRDFSDAHG